MNLCRHVFLCQRKCFFTYTTSYYNIRAALYILRMHESRQWKTIKHISKKPLYCIMEILWGYWNVLGMLNIIFNDLYKKFLWQVLYFYIIVSTSLKLDFSSFSCEEYLISAGRDTALSSFLQISQNYQNVLNERIEKLFLQLYAFYFRRRSLTP